MSNRLIAGYFVLAVFSLAFLVIAIVVIRVLTLDTPSPPTPESKKASYVVRAGDSLAGISRETGVPVGRIEELNPGIDPLALMPGARIRLKKPTARERRRAKARRARRPRVYVVKPGDGLLGIAAKTGVDVTRLRSLNRDKKVDKLVPGMRLRLGRR